MLLSMPLKELDASMSLAFSSLLATVEGIVEGAPESEAALAATVEAAAPPVEAAAPPAETAATEAKPPKRAPGKETEINSKESISSSSVKSTAFAASLLGTLIMLW